MENMINNNPLLDLLDYPAFMVQNGIITQANRMAILKNIMVGQAVTEYLDTLGKVYQEFKGDCLYLQLHLSGGCTGATVTIADQQHLFCLDHNLPDEPNYSLRSLPQIAVHLRRPLHALFCTEEEKLHNESVRQNLYQIHRIVSNMADVPRFQDRDNINLESTDLFGFFSDLIEKSTVLLKKSGIYIQYTALPQYINAMIDREMVERAVYNLISNAAKFSPPNGTIQIKLTASNSALYFTIQDQGPGIDTTSLGTLFYRYRRHPDIEDSRNGVGFGMAIVKAAADAHGGTVLIERPPEGGTRVTLAIALQFNTQTVLHSTVMLPQSKITDNDHPLMELCDILPHNAF